MPGGWIWESPPTFRFQRGDDSRWATPDFDDASWSTVLPNQIPARDGIYWVRFRLPGNELVDPAGLVRDGIAMVILASYDLYWDGRLIGSNGLAGPTAASERPGNIDALFQIPGELATPGEHVVALRLSSFHTGFPAPHYGVNFTLGNFAQMVADKARRAMQSLIALGAFGGLALGFGVAWWLVDRRPAVLRFAAVAVVAALIQAVQAWRWLYEYPYSWHYARTLAFTSLAALVGWLLVAAVLWLFALPRRRTILAVLTTAYVVAWVSTPFYSVKGYWICFSALLLSTAVSAWAVMQRRKYAAILLVGLMITVLSLLATPWALAERTFVLSLGATLASAFVLLGLQWRAERRAARQAQLTAARLEIELLKKNIQPHFLMNTLTTLMEVVETEPGAAVELISALAEEFRILGRVSGERLIPLGQEIELCEAHLKIMSVRRNGPCELQVDVADRSSLVPPALFHTLIENGFTHQTSADVPLRFHLREECGDQRVRYELLALGTPASVSQMVERRDGTGSRYIKARLEESFPGRWSMTAEAATDGWRTVVEIADEPR